MLRRFFAGFLLLFCGCNPRPSSPVDSLLLADAGIDGGASDAGDPTPLSDAGQPFACPAYSHQVGEKQCASTVSWAELPSGPLARDHHHTFIAQTEGAPFLFVTGGGNRNQGENFRDLEMAPILASGELGAWKAGEPPPMFQAGSGVAQANNRTYLLGGMSREANTFKVTPKVFSFVPAQGGADAQWVEEAPLPEGRFHSTANVFKKWLYVIGGVGPRPGKGSRSVFRAEIQPNGTLISWQEIAVLPNERTHHVSEVIGQKLFVWGGFDGAGSGFRSKQYRDGWVATFNDDGTLGPFESRPLPFGTSASSVTRVGDAVYVVAGFESETRISSNVWRGKLENDEVVLWEKATSFPLALAHVHQSPSWNGFLYSVGGELGSHVSTNRIFRAKVE